MCHPEQVPNVKWKEKRFKPRELKKITLDDSFIIFNPTCRDAIARVYESSPAALRSGRGTSSEARGAAPKKH